MYTPTIIIIIMTTTPSVVTSYFRLESWSSSSVCGVSLRVPFLILLIMSLLRKCKFHMAIIIMVIL